MQKITFDSDGLIKLAKAGILEEITSRFSCLTTNQVKEEAVDAGKQRHYDDASVIEAQINLRKISVIQAPIELLDYLPQLGKGEKSVIVLATKVKPDAVVSDDRKFLQVLEERGIPFTTPTQLIVAMTKAKALNSGQAIQAIEKIREAVSKESYSNAMKQLGGEKK